MTHSSSSPDTTGLDFFSENVDAWGAAEWFNRLAKAVRRHGDAVRANDEGQMAICQNVAISSAWRLVSDYEQQVRAALQPSSAGSEEDWQDDPASDERWNAGLDFAMEHLCKVLGVNPREVNWDAATETLDGDVMAVIGNVLRAKFGEDWGPNDPAQGWRDISTAPKNGTEIWLYREDCDAFLGRWIAPCEFLNEDEYEGDDGWDECDWFFADFVRGGRVTDGAPTHWMPLPTSPLPSTNGDTP